MSQAIELWAQCLQLYNLLPTLVEDRRPIDLDGTTGAGGVVRFLATARDCTEDPFEGLYDDDDILALGAEDEDGCTRWVAVEEFFNNEPCIVVVRVGASYLETSTCALDVTVFLAATDETRSLAIEQVRAASLEDEFTNLMEERRTAEMTPPDDEPTGSTSELPHQQGGRSLLDRWFGPKNITG